MARWFIALLACVAFATPVQAKDTPAGKDKPRARPKSKPKGKAYTLRLALDPDLAHVATVTQLQHGIAPDQEYKLSMEAQTSARVVGKEGESVRVGADIGLRRFVIDDKELTDGAAEAATGAHVLARMNGAQSVARVELKGTKPLGPFGNMFRPLPAWVLPWLPEEPVKKGQVWSIPPKYLVWMLNQSVNAPLSGDAYQVFEAVEEVEGVKVARIKTLFDLTRQEKDVKMMPKGLVDTRIAGEMTQRMGLDGYLRSSELRMRMKRTHTETKRELDFTMSLSVESGPGPVPTKPLGKDWTLLMGDLPFVVGYDAGMAEAKFTGRAPMFFYTSFDSAGGRNMAKTALKDEDVVKWFSVYTPILIDAEVEKDFAEKVKGAIAVDPSFLFVDLDGDTIFNLVGNSPMDIFKMTAEIPFTRKPDPRPTPEYEALVEALDALDAAMKATDRRAAVAALLEIRTTTHAIRIQRQADAAEADLTTYANEQMQQAEALLKAKQSKQRTEGRAVLEALAATFAGHAIADRANARLARLAKKK